MPWHATTWHAVTSGCSDTHLAKPLWLLLLLFSGAKTSTEDN
jgi:hypothetical protein